MARARPHRKQPPLINWQRRCRDRERERSGFHMISLWLITVVLICPAFVIPHVGVSDRPSGEQTAPLCSGGRRRTSSSCLFPYALIYRGLLSKETLYIHIVCRVVSSLVPSHITRVPKSSPAQVRSWRRRNMVPLSSRGARCVCLSVCLGATTTPPTAPPFPQPL